MSEEARRRHLLSRPSLGKEITGGNPAVRVSEVAKLDDRDVTWLEAGKKVRYWKNFGNSVKVQQARKASAPQVQVKKYTSEREIQRDAQKLIAAGSHIEGQSSRTKHFSLATGFFTNKGVTTVTSIKDPVGVPSDTSANAITSTSPPTDTRNDIPGQIRKLADLHAADTLTDDEFPGKKAELLARM